MKTMSGSEILLTLGRLPFQGAYPLELDPSPPILLSPIVATIAMNLMHQHMAIFDLTLTSYTQISLGHPKLQNCEIL